MITKIILGWLIFDVLVYACMWFEHAYYTHDLPEKFRQIVNSLTEEE